MRRRSDASGRQSPRLDGYLHEGCIIFVVIIVHVEIDPAGFSEPSLGKSIPDASFAAEGDWSVCFVEFRELFDLVDAIFEYSRAQLWHTRWILPEASGVDQQAVCGSEE